ncbi:hypothetical protein EV426DRAFT_400328 [Tirmania nivea]|nr:hypothetical protein EV426DRAFT_686831 [Tirmania nivea]KAF8418347.1 hypothetical protein EV426DRAFT_700574 [Tirmania nivea]KAF8427302.1 hypothetical protein EV426DRAFT_400328 [Tirmania nivea]
MAGGNRRKPLQVLTLNQNVLQAVTGRSTIATPRAKLRHGPKPKALESDRRIMTTHVVGPAFCKDKKAMIQKSFRDVGVTLPPDGSQDDELHIKGFDPQDLYQCRHSPHVSA